MKYDEDVVVKEKKKKIDLIFDTRDKVNIPDYSSICLCYSSAYLARRSHGIGMRGCDGQNVNGTARSVQHNST